MITCLPTPELAEAAVDYGMAMHVPVVVDVQDPWPEVYMTVVPHPFRGTVRLTLRHEFERVKRLLRTATAVVAVSEEYLKWALARSGRDRQAHDGVYYLGYPASIAHCVDEADVQSLRSRYGIGTSDSLFSFVGSFGISYDLKTAVSAARILRNAGLSRLRIVLAGAGEQHAGIARIARGLENVTLTGWLDSRSVLALLRCSAAGIAAYASRSLQSMPYKPFEYMAAGLPVVSSLRGEFASIIERDRIGYQYEAGSAESLAAALIGFAENPESTLDMGRRARQVLESRFDADLITGRLADALEQVHTEHAAGPQCNARRRTGEVPPESFRSLT